MSQVAFIGNVNVYEITQTNGEKTTFIHVGESHYDTNTGYANMAKYEAKIKKKTHVSFIQLLSTFASQYMEKTGSPLTVFCENPAVDDCVDIGQLPSRVFNPYSINRSPIHTFERWRDLDPPIIPIPEAFDLKNVDTRIPNQPTFKTFKTTSNIQQYVEHGKMSIAWTRSLVKGSGIGESLVNIVYQEFKDSVQTLNESRSRKRKRAAVDDMFDALVLLPEAVALTICSEKAPSICVLISGDFHTTRLMDAVEDMEQDSIRLVVRLCHPELVHNEDSNASTCLPAYDLQTVWNTIL